MDYTPAKVRNASVDFSNMLCIPHRLEVYHKSAVDKLTII